MTMIFVVVVMTIVVEKEQRLSMKNLTIIILVLVIWVMGEMDITPNEALHLVQHTLPNFIKYKLS